MILFLQILGICILALIVILVALLVLPVRIMARGRGDTDDGFDVGGRVMPFGGLCGAGLRYDGCSARVELYVISWRLASFKGEAAAGRVERFAVWAKKRKKPAEKEETVEVPERKPLSERLREGIVKGRTMRPLIFRAIHELVRIIRFDRCYADIRFGFSDPALTGMLAGIIYSVNGLLPSSCTITPSWDFTRTVAGGELDIDISILNYRIWGALVRLMPAVIRTRREFAGATS